MTTLKTNRKQRLRSLERQIRKDYEVFVTAGKALAEIRDDRLYDEAGFESWEKYLRQRVAEEFGIEKTQANKMIQAAVIRLKLPDLPNYGHRGDHHSKNGSTSEARQWSQKAVNAFADLAPVNKAAHGRPRDVSKLKKQDLQRVARLAIEKAGDDQPVTSTHVKQAIAEETGQARKPKPKTTRRPQIDLDAYLLNIADHVETGLKTLDGLNVDVWEQLEVSHPGLAARVADGCDALAEFLRS